MDTLFAPFSTKVVWTLSLLLSLQKLYGHSLCSFLYKSYMDTFFAPFSTKVVWTLSLLLSVLRLCGHFLVTLPVTVKDTSARPTPPVTSVLARPSLNTVRH